MQRRGPGKGGLEKASRREKERSPEGRRQRPRCLDSAVCAVWVWAPPGDAGNQEFSRPRLQGSRPEGDGMLSASPTRRSKPKTETTFIRLDKNGSQRADLNAKRTAIKVRGDPNLI
jgi:hypothetical protein